MDPNVTDELVTIMPEEQKRHFSQPDPQAVQTVVEAVSTIQITKQVQTS